MRKYSWSRSYAVDPQVVGEIIEKLPESTADNLLKEARKKKSPLHQLFEWDDTYAANEYRLIQARTMINSLKIEIITTDSKPENVTAFIRDVNKPCGYIATLDADDDSLTAAEQRCYRQMLAFKEKWNGLKLAKTVCDSISDIDRSLKRRNVA